MDYNNNYQASYQPQYNAPRPKSVGAGALVCGLIALVGPWLVNALVLDGLSLSNASESLTTVLISYVISLALSITAISLGAKGMSTGKATGAPKGMAIAGLVLGIIAAVIAFGNILCYISL